MTYSSLFLAQIPMSFLFPLVLLIAAAFGIKLLMQLFKGSRMDQPAIRKVDVYRKRASLMTPAERAFYGVLVQAVEGQYRVFSKVRLLDILDTDSSLSPGERQSALNSIQSKHVDFVLCDPVSLSIEGIVELDDSSHARADRQKRDAFVNQALSSAGIPFFHIPVRRNYTAPTLRSTLFNEVKVPTPPPFPS